MSLLTLVVTLVGLLQIPPIATWMTRRLVRFVPLNSGYQLEVGGAHGTWLRGLTVENVMLVRGSQELAWIGRLDVRYRVNELLGSPIRIREIHVEGARAQARRQGDTWDLADAFRTSKDTTSGGGLAVDLMDARDIALEAELSPDSLVRVRGLSMLVRSLSVAETTTAVVERLSLAASPPASPTWFAVSTRGHVSSDLLTLDPLRIQTERSDIAAKLVLPLRLDDTPLLQQLDVRLKAAPLALADIAALVPGVAPDGTMRIEASAGARNRLVTFRIDALVGRGTLALTGSTELEGGKPAGYRVQGTTRDLDPSKLSVSGPAGRINGTVDLDLRGVADSAVGTADLSLTRSQIGTTTLERVDLRTKVARGRAEVKLRGTSGRTGVAVDGWIRPFDSVPGYRFAGSATGLPGTAAAARTLAGAESDSVLDARFKVEGKGLAPATAVATGSLDLSVARASGERIVVGRTSVALEGRRLLARPDVRVGGGRISAVATARIGDTLTYRVRDGTISGVDVGRLAGDSLSAPLDGTFSLHGSGTALKDAVAVAELRLDELRYGARRVDSVSAGVRLDRGRATMAVRGAVQGGRIAADLAGRPFDSTASFRLTRGTVDSVDLGTFMDRPELAGPVSLRVVGNGRWGPRIKQATGTVTIDPSRVGQVDVAAGTLRATLADRVLRYEASVRTTGGAVTFAGDGTPLSASPAYAIRRGRADSLDLGTLLGRAGMHSDLDATFTATHAGAGDSTETAVEVDIRPSTVNQVTLTGGRVALAMRRQSVTGELRLESPDGDLGAKVDGRMSDGPTRWHTSGTATLEHLAKWTGRTGADGRLEGTFDLGATTDSAGLRSIDGTAAAIGGIGGVRLLGARLVLAPLDGAVQVDTLEIRSNVGHLVGRGTVALRDGAAPGLLRLDGRLGDLEPLAALAGADTVSLDSGSVTLQLGGPANRWRFEARGRGSNLQLAGALVEQVALDARGSLDRTGLRGVEGKLHLRDGVYGKVVIPEIEVAARYDSLVALDASAAIGDSIRIATRVRGTVAGDTIHAVVQRLDLDEPSGGWALERPTTLELGPRTIVDRLALVSGKRRIALDGTFDTRDSSDVTLGIQDLDLGAFRSAGLLPIGGRLDASFHLVGRAADPTLKGSIALDLPSVEGKPAGRLGAELLWQRDGLEIKGTGAPPTGGHLTIEGTVPYRLTLAPSDSTTALGVARGEVDTLGIRIRADSFDLSFFQPLLPPDAATGLTGALVADGRIGGRLDAPEASGTFALSRAALTLPALGVSYEQGEIIGRLDGEELRIERLKLLTGKKQMLLGKGVVHLKPLTDPGLEISVGLEDFRISDSPTLRSVASGTIQLAGTMSAPRLTGAVTLGATDVFVGEAATAASVEKVELTPAQVRAVARDFGPSVLTREAESASLLARLSMDLNLQLPRRVWIRRRKSPAADIELSGQMRLTQEPGGQMQFTGTVEPVPGRGSLDLSGRTFRITGGEIYLNGPVDSTRLDVTASYQVPTQGGGEDNGVVITVAAKGRLDSLGLEFTSEPTMSREDVLSYIVTGHPASDNSLLGGGGEGTSGKQIAFDQLSEALSTTAGRGLGFDVFQIKQEGARGLNLTAGRYLSDRFFLNLKLPLGSGSASAPGENLGPGFELEYSARRWLRAGLQGGSLPPGFSLRGRHAY